MTAQIHVDDIGTDFRATIKDEDGNVVDVSTATTLEMIFNKPNGDAVVQTADVANGGTDGVIHYVTVSGDVDQEGEWRIQGFVIIGTNEFYSDIHAFNVYGNLSRPAV